MGQCGSSRGKAHHMMHFWNHSGITSWLPTHSPAAVLGVHLPTGRALGGGGGTGGYWGLGALGSRLALHTTSVARPSPRKVAVRPDWGVPPMFRVSYPSLGPSVQGMNATFTPVGDR